MDFSSMSPAEMTTLIVIIGGVVIAVGIIGVGLMISLFSKVAFMFEHMGGLGAVVSKKPVASAAPKTAVAMPANGVPGEVVAAISAAVAEVMGTGNFRIQSVRKKADGRSPWSMAGVLQNTKPF